MDVIAKITEELQVQKWQVEAAVKLIDEGNTIPFISRYRKEVTGSLNDEQLRNLHERLLYLRSLVDEYRFITYAETLRAIHLLAKYEGIFVGASSGASLAVAIKLALENENEGKLIVPLLPDNGERYLSEELQRVRPEVEDKVGF